MKFQLSDEGAKNGDIDRNLNIFGPQNSRMTQKD